MIYRTREAWLNRAIQYFRKTFSNAGYPLPEDIHVSVGFSYGARAESATVLGSCWSTLASEDGKNHIFISPEISKEVDMDGTDLGVLETLLHELIHAADNCTSGHQGNFVTIAKALSLVKPWTFTPLTPLMHAELVVLAGRLGAYPHGALHPRTAKLATATGGTIQVPVGEFPGKLHSGPPKQKTYMRKLTCSHCGYTVRTTTKFIEKGLPLCPSGIQMDVE